MECSERATYDRQLHFRQGGQTYSVLEVQLTTPALRLREKSRFTLAQSHNLLSVYTAPKARLSAAMAFALQTPMSSSLSFKSHTADARPFLAPRTAPVSRGMRMAVVPMAKGPSLKPKTNIAKVPRVFTLRDVNAPVTSNKSDILHIGCASIAAHPV